MKCILITGGAGLLGRRVVSLFREQRPDYRIVVVDKVPMPDGIVKSGQIEWISGDLCDLSTWARIPLTITHVCHLAAMIPWKGNDKYCARTVRGNIMPAALLAEYGRRWSRLEHVVFSSSISVYAASKEYLSGKSAVLPSDLYGASKLACESVLLSLTGKGVRLACLRFSSLYGSGQYQGTVLPVMVNNAIRGEEISVHGSGNRTQDFLFCEDAARSVFLVSQKNVEGTFPVGSGVPISMKTLAETVNMVFAGGKGRIVFDPELKDGNSCIKVDISEARKIGYKPEFSLEKGLRALQGELKKGKNK